MTKDDTVAVPREVLREKIDPVDIICHMRPGVSRSVALDFYLQRHPSSPLYLHVSPDEFGIIAEFLAAKINALLGDG